MSRVTVQPYVRCPYCPKCGRDARSRRYVPSVNVLAFDCDGNDGCGHQWATEPKDAPTPPTGYRAREQSPRTVDLPDEVG